MAPNYLHARVLPYERPGIGIVVAITYAQARELDSGKILPHLSAAASRVQDTFWIVFQLIGL